MGNDTQRTEVSLGTKRQRLCGSRGESHPLLPLHQLGRKVLVELLLLHVRGFDLHAVLQHVDVVGLSVHCNVTTRFKRWLFVNFLFRCRLSAMSNS